MGALTNRMPEGAAAGKVSILHRKHSEHPFPGTHEGCPYGDWIHHNRPCRISFIHSLRNFPCGVLIG